MLVKILQIAILAVWVLINLITAFKMDAKEMKEDFVDGQCVVGRICANLFYVPAWVLKFVKAAVLLTIA